MNELYNFGSLDEQLTKWGFPVIDGKSGFQSIRIDFNAQNFQKAVREGTIQFRADGIYLIHEGREWKGYMYMPTYRVKRYNSMPRFHLTRCEKIQELFSGGHGHYYKWSNNKLNDITERDTREVYENQKLQLCSHCRASIIGIKDTEDFFETLETEEPETKSVEVDIFGYDKNWQKISREYRKIKNYTCENCGVKPARDFDKRFWHTHHKDGDKTNNKQPNLECLCILCHSYKDHTHEGNFDKASMKRPLETFVKQYREELKKLGNSYLGQYGSE